MDLESQKPAAKKRPTCIYLDNQATTPVDPEVIAAMLPYIEEHFGNPASQGHRYGWKADMAVEEARKEVAKLINADPDEIFWTSGATESNNMVIQGIALKNLNQPMHFICSNIEHKAVLESCMATLEWGSEVSQVRVNSLGQVEESELESALKPHTKLVSIMTANNEIGSINPIEKLCRKTQNNGSLFHTDAAQAVGKIPIDVKKWNVDFLSLSGHKIYGPKGVGALYVKRGMEHKLKPLFYGGDQEKGIRPGTLNVAGIVGLGKACEKAGRIMADESIRLLDLKQKVLEALAPHTHRLLFNGHPTERLCNNLSISFRDLSSDDFSLALSGMAYSSGSACSSASLQASYVLRALGLEEQTARASLRLGLGRFTTEEEVEFAIGKILKLLSK